MDNPSRSEKKENKGNLISSSRMRPSLPLRLITLHSNF
jgi:hypothetical protein